MEIKVEWKKTLGWSSIKSMAMGAICNCFFVGGSGWKEPFLRWYAGMAGKHGRHSWLDGWMEGIS